MSSKIFNILPLVVLLFIVQSKLGSVDTNNEWQTTLVTFFVAILLEAMPFVLIGSLVSGILETMVPQERIASFVPKNKFLAVAVFGLLGAIFPMCECGIVPVIRRLLRKRVPLSCGITYLLAAPIVQPLVLAATYVAFNGSWKMAGLRILGGYLVACTVGMLSAVVLDPNSAEHIAFDLDASDSHDCGHDHGHDCGHDHDHDRDKRAVGLALPMAPVLASAAVGAHSGEHRLSPLHHASSASDGDISLPRSPSSIPLPIIDDGFEEQPKRSFIGNTVSVLKSAKSDFLSTGYYLIFGALLAACMQTFVSQGVLAKIGHGPFTSVLVMMALAFTMSLCSAADAFVAAAFTQFSIASRLAFLVMGPMVDIKLLAMYNGFLSKKATAFVFGFASLLAFAYAMALHYLGVK